MSHTSTQTISATTGGERPQAEAAPLAPSTATRVWSGIQFFVSLALTVGVLAYLLFVPASVPPSDRDKPHPAIPDVVHVEGPRLLRIHPGTPLDSKLEVSTARQSQMTDAVLPVTGRVAASLRPTAGRASDYWQFDSADELTAYIDWQTSQADVAFNEGQLQRVRKLADTRAESQKKVVERLQKLVAAGTDSPKDLAVEQTNLLQYQIEGQKQIYEAETAVRAAKRQEAARARQLQQTGLEPTLLRSAKGDIDIVLADVPEGKLSRVKVGQSCQARFFGIPGQVFTGKIKIVAPVLSKERRSVRVLFLIDDPKDQLRPGMYADIGLGTDPRTATLVPADGVLHIGRADYALVTESENLWRIVEVQVGEPHNGGVEILDGLKAGDRVLGKGAILLKPLVMRALLPVSSSTAGPPVVGARARQ